LTSHLKKVSLNARWFNDFKMLQMTSVDNLKQPQKENKAPNCNNLKEKKTSDLNKPKKI